MHKIKAVITDLDGTLLNDSHQISERDKQSLRNLAKDNIIRIAATGRSIFAADLVLKSEPIFDYLIFANGIGIKNMQSGKIFNTHQISKDEALNISQRINQLEVDYQIRSTVPNCHQYLYKQFSDINTDFEKLNALYGIHARKLISETQISNASRIICMTDDENVAEKIRREFSEFGIVRATSPVNNRTVWMEIYPEGIHKGSGVQYLCKKLGIALKDTVGIGNDYNDTDFLDIVNQAFVVSNAAEILTKKYTELRVSNNENPLTNVLKNL